MKAPIKNTPEIKVTQISFYDERFYRLDIPKEDGKLDTRWIASVTTKLGVVAKPFLGHWRGDVGNREADMRMHEAANRGKRIHHAWYTFTTGGAIIYNPWDRPTYSEETLKEIASRSNGNVAIMQYQDEMIHLWRLEMFVKELKPVFLASEQMVYSLKHNDAGTADNIISVADGLYEINGTKPIHIPKGNYVLDLKTGNQVDDDAFLQTSAYAKCAEEMGLAQISGTLIAHTGAKTKGKIPGLATLLRMTDEMDQDYYEYRKTAELWELKNPDAAPKLFTFPSLISLNKELYTFTPTN